MAKSGRSRTTGGHGSVSGQLVSRCESLRYSRETRHHSAERYPVGETIEGGVGDTCLSGGL